MKSLKTLALALIIVAGSAQANIFNTIDTKIFGGTIRYNAKNGRSTYRHVTTGLPIFRSYLNFKDPYARAVVVTATAAGIVYGSYKLYKYFTKPAADATVEGENVEANNEANVA